MFRLKTRFKRYYYKKNTLLCIDRIEIKHDMLFEIIDLFKCKNLIIIVDLDKNSKLFSEFKEKKIKYSVFSLGKNNIYVETVFLLSNENINILNNIITEDIESLYVLGDDDFYNFKSGMARNEYDNWMKECKSNLYVQFIFKENEINISYNNKIYNKSFINTNIKRILEKYSNNQNIFEKIKKNFQ